MENKNNCDNDLLKRCGVTQSQFKGSNGKVLNYCRKEAGDWSKVEKVPLVLFCTEQESVAIIIGVSLSTVQAN